jgi:hypothetical protein
MSPEQPEMGLSLAVLAQMFLFMTGAALIVSAGIGEWRRGVSRLLSSGQSRLFGMAAAWAAVVCLRGVPPDYGGIQSAAFLPDLAWPWLLPVVALAGMRAEAWPAIVDTLKKQTWIAVPVGVVGLVGGVVRPELLPLLNAEALYGASFLSLFLAPAGGWSVVVPVLGMLLVLAKAALGGVRGQMLYALLYLAGAVVLMIRSGRLSFGKRLLLLGGLAVLTTFLVTRGPGALERRNIYSTERNWLQEKGIKSDRGDLALDFFDGRSPLEIAVGGGAAAEYWSAAVGTFRRNIEVGWLQIVLKGGIILAVLYGLTLGAAVVSALVPARNGLAVVAGLVVAERMLNWIHGATPWFSPKDVIVWLCLGACLSVPIRTAPQRRMME